MCTYMHVERVQRAILDASLINPHIPISSSSLPPSSPSPPSSSSPSTSSLTGCLSKPEANQLSQVNCPESSKELPVSAPVLGLQTHALLHLAFHGFWGYELKSFCVHSRHFIRWAVASAEEIKNKNKTGKPPYLLWGPPPLTHHC